MVRKQVWRIGNVSPSKFAVIAGVTFALLMSTVDALGFEFGPYWLGRPIAMMDFPGELGAWFVYGILGDGHSVTSATVEFVLSLPFNFVAYWLLSRVCASVIVRLIPIKQFESTQSTTDPRKEGEHGSQG